jgi:hypothetical protein
LSRRKLILLVATLLIFAAAITGVVTAVRDREGVRPQPVPSQLSAENVQRLAAALNSGTKRGQAAALASAFRGAYDAQDKAIFQPGRRITLHPDTFKQAGSVGATVEAEISRQGKILLLLVRENGQWLIFGTDSVN